VRRLGLVVLVLLACRKPGLSDADGALHLGSTTLDFGDTWLLSSVQRPLTLDNTGQGPLDLAFSVVAPFTAPPPLHLPGGASLTIQPGFLPIALGHASATLTIHSGSSTATVLLEGNGVQPPACDPSACRSATLDPSTGLCIQTPKPDGTACSDACLSNASCLAGNCVGTMTTSCDDGDPCTTDACDPTNGCSHSPTVCPSTDPCNAPTCDPGVGCTAHPAPDGTVCGDSDCTTAHVCIAGACVSRAVPDGAACGHASICQPAGRCQAQQCVRDPATVISRQWMYVPPNQHQLAGIVGDGENTLYTADCAFQANFISQCQLVAFDPMGNERWRTSYPHTSYNGGGALRDALMMARGYVISTIGRDWVDVFDAATGKPKWNLNLETLALFPSGSYPLVHPLSVGFDGTQLVLVLEGSNAGSLSGDAVIALDVETGALLHHVALPQQAFSIVIDKQGLTYLSHASMSGMQWYDTVSAFDPVLGVRWQKQLAPDGDWVRQMLATRGGDILISAYDHSELLSVQNGSVLTAALGQYWFSGGPVWGPNALFAHRQYCAMSSCSGFSDYTIDLEIVDDVTLAKKAARLSPYAWSSGTWLTSNNTALMTLWPDVLGAKPELREYDASGQMLMACPLQFSENAVSGGPVLGNGHYAALTGGIGEEGGEHLEVWSVPGYAPGTSGWVSPRGGRSFDLREQ
jgi:hypothetical protein